MIRGPERNSSDEEAKLINHSPIEFVAMPSNMKVAANGTAILNLVAKLKNSYQLATAGKE